MQLSACVSMPILSKLNRHPATNQRLRRLQIFTLALLKPAANLRPTEDYSGREAIPRGDQRRPKSRKNALEKRVTRGTEGEERKFLSFFVVTLNDV